MFCQEVRGNTEVPESDIVQACRRVSASKNLFLLLLPKPTSACVFVVVEHLFRSVRFVCLSDPAAGREAEHECAALSSSYRRVKRV